MGTLRGRPVGGRVTGREVSVSRPPVPPHCRCSIVTLICIINLPDGNSGEMYISINLESCWDSSTIATSRVGVK